MKDHKEMKSFYTFFIKLTLGFFITSCLNIVWADSKQTLFNDFSKQNLPIAIWQKGKIQYIELCGDWCQLISWKISSNQQVEAAWDAAFVMHYFFDANEDYQSKREKHAQSLLKKYKKFCPSTEISRQQAGCILSHLQNNYGLNFNRVQYDEGYRCISIFIPKEPFFTKEGKCHQIKFQKETSLRVN